MVEMTEQAAIVVVVPELTVRRGESVESFFHVTMSECHKCYSLQPCVSDATTYRCADWRACKIRQYENRYPAPVKLTDADIAGLLERMEVQQMDMERLKCIEQAAISFVQASEAFMAIRGHAPMLDAHGDLLAAERALIDVVKGSK
jgi:hypothetical protein